MFRGKLPERFGDRNRAADPCVQLGKRSDRARNLIGLDAEQDRAFFGKPSVNQP